MRVMLTPVDVVLLVLSIALETVANPVSSVGALDSDEPRIAICNDTASTSYVGETSVYVSESMPCNALHANPITSLRKLTFNTQPPRRPLQLPRPLLTSDRPIR